MKQVLLKFTRAERWWHTPLIPAPRQVDLCAFEASLVCKSYFQDSFQSYSEKPWIEKTNPQNHIVPHILFHPPLPSITQWHLIKPYLQMSCMSVSLHMPQISQNTCNFFWNPVYPCRHRVGSLPSTPQPFPCSFYEVTEAWPHLCPVSSSLPKRSMRNNHSFPHCA